MSENIPQWAEAAYLVKFPFDELCDSAEDAAGRVLSWAGFGMQAEAVIRIERNAAGLEVGVWVCCVLGVAED